jgi:hypothetical protein
VRHEGSQGTAGNGYCNIQRQKETQASTCKWRGIRVGEQHSQYDGTDAVTYNRVTTYTYAGDVLLPHIKFHERGWNEYDEMKESVCDKMINKTGNCVPHCIEKDWFWNNTIAGMVHIKYRNMKCNYHNAVLKAILRKFLSLVIDYVFKMITNPKIIIGELQKGGHTIC